MIIIFSKNYGENTTDDVLNWLHHHKKDNEVILRINGDDLLNKDFYIDVSNSEFNFNNQKINNQIVHTIWFRRTFDQDFLNIEPKIFNDFHNNKTLENHLLSELGTIYRFLESFLDNSVWINKYSESLNKLKTLKLAEKHGLKIPDTYITNKIEIINQLATDKNLITKPISDAVTLFDDDSHYMMYTSEVSEIKKEGYIFPTKLQSKIDKKFELRIFYIDDVFYSMAIFSQNDHKTKVDFRNYNFKKSNRNVPYKLPVKIESSLKELVKELNLKTCSIDMIVSKDEEYYFLEINPVGQFGMVSQPCNYHLEEQMALYILKNYEENNNEV
ncbi:ATP-GRASP peptide maturase, grasp-with-spasm system [Chryseobacterium oranimense]|uniref:ATP-GRASP peptide maturase, grasp-with-spasm system n=1 Tax=Chryseobacterium oranimense TaxID=421058 RepID=A0A1M5K4W3_9FLAO|nr:grasp-with-spasm system ATP-grasp peptide maturase [Chryseobacterium oranimense]SHG47858.1 ATP-GRASP peptide maturase, grasp-with-spasm system [Chryseobacterium oranimense]